MFQPTKTGWRFADQRLWKPGLCAALFTTYFKVGLINLKHVLWTVLSCMYFGPGSGFKFSPINAIALFDPHHIQYIPTIIFDNRYSNMNYILVLTLLLDLILMVKMEPNVGNCLRKDEIDVLEKEGKCASASLQEADGSKQLRWERCLETLAKKLDQRCDGLGVSKV